MSSSATPPPGSHVPAPRFPISSRPGAGVACCRARRLRCGGAARHGAHDRSVDRGGVPVPHRGRVVCSPCSPSRQRGCVEGAADAVGRTSEVRRGALLGQSLSCCSQRLTSTRPGLTPWPQASSTTLKRRAEFLKRCASGGSTARVVGGGVSDRLCQLGIEISVGRLSWTASTPQAGWCARAAASSACSTRRHGTGCFTGWKLLRSEDKACWTRVQPQSERHFE